MEDWPKPYSKTRGKQGWCKEDTYSFDNYLAKVISGGVRYISTLKVWKCFTVEEHCCEKTCKKKWKKILENIADGFEWYYENQYSTDWKIVEKRRKETLDLFSENFSGLWW